MIDLSLTTFAWQNELASFLMLIDPRTGGLGGENFIVWSLSSDESSSSNKPCTNSVAIFEEVWQFVVDKASLGPDNLSEEKYSSSGLSVSG